MHSATGEDFWTVASVEVGCRPCRTASKRRRRSADEAQVRHRLISTLGTDVVSPKIRQSIKRLFPDFNRHRRMVVRRRRCPAATAVVSLATYAVTPHGAATLIVPRQVSSLARHIGRVYEWRYSSSSPRLESFCSVNYAGGTWRILHLPSTCRCTRLVLFIAALSRSGSDNDRNTFLTAWSTDLKHSCWLSARRSSRRIVWYRLICSCCGLKCVKCI